MSKDHDHPCPIPVELARRIVLVTTEPGDRIVDPFSGSGTIPAVAAAFGREGIGIDISEDYCEIARARLGTIIDELNNSPEEINENREQNDNVVYLSGVHRAFRFLARPTQGKKHLVKVEEVERWLSKSGLDNIGWTRTNL